MSLKKPRNDYTDISITSQELRLIRDGKALNTYLISTGKNGVGSTEDSGKTPLGEHQICEKIGDHAPVGTIFQSRKDTGAVWHKDDHGPENLILTRILRLQGCEEGVNKGSGIDSYNRYIYIHGTNREEALGKEPVSHGCILMSNSDIQSYFNQISEGEHVSIHQ